MKNTIGARIAEQRKQKGMTQEALAETLGVSAQAVSKWENDVSCPDISLLPALAEKLEISLDKGKVKEGEKVKVNVRTSDDVAYITVNGETVTLEGGMGLRP